MENHSFISQEAARIVDPKIKQVLGLYLDKKTKKLVEYQNDAGGKRLRPVLAIVSCLVCGGKEKDVLYPAAGLEILHNYTLIIDDMIDNSNLRRGEPTPWFKFGKSIAQCVGVIYGVALFQAGNLSKDPVRSSDLFAKAMKTVIDGEILDILFEQAGRKDEKYIIDNRCKRIVLKDYLKMIRKKTAFLIQASCEIGGIAAQAEKSEIVALKKYGLNLGMAFQIKDDILDIFGEEKIFGKRIGNDIVERKLGNIVIFYALKELPQLKRKKVITTLGKKKIEDEDIKEVMKIIEGTNARENAFLLADNYIQKAKESLELLPDNKWNKVLDEIADFVIERDK